MALDTTLYKNHPIPGHVASELMSATLEEKEFMTYQKLTEWYLAWEGKCYVSFSGGKDSTLLSYLVAQCITENEWKHTPLVLLWIDTGLEYPELREFVPKYVKWLKYKFPKLDIRLEVRKPEMNFRQVIAKYGYPVISKEIAKKVHDARNCPTGAVMEGFSKHDPDSKFNWDHYAYLLDAPFRIDSRCCDVMKKRPANKFAKETGLHQIIGTMAEESNLRKTKWMRMGCNAFEAKHPSSAPLSFWREQDVLQYLSEHKIPIASCYGKIVHEFGIWYTTKCQRTGCMFCAFGAHLEKAPNRFQRMALTHPTQYAWMLKPYEEGGLGLAAVLDWLKIPYEPVSTKEFKGIN